MNVEKTPTKRVPQARKAEASQFCRVCHRSFQSKAGYISTENIFQIPKKKGLNKTVDDLGFSGETGELLSTRVCSTCGSKVRAAAVTISILKSNLGCVRLTVFRNRNTWNISLKSFIFTEIHIKIVKHLLKCYFKHIFTTLAASRRAKYTVLIINPRILIPE